jgi:hypothetical protein
MVSLSSVQSDYGDLNKWFESVASSGQRKLLPEFTGQRPFSFFVLRNFTRSTTEDYLRDDCPPQGSGHMAITCVAWPPQDQNKIAVP